MHPRPALLFWVVVFVGKPNGTPAAPRDVEDPLLRQAVLDLFRANLAFRDAFVSGDAQDMDEAATRIDKARERVFVVQTVGDRFR